MHTYTYQQITSLTILQKHLHHLSIHFHTFPNKPYITSIYHNTPHTNTYKITTINLHKTHFTITINTYKSLHIKIKTQKYKLTYTNIHKHLSKLPT